MQIQPESLKKAMQKNKIKTQRQLASVSGLSEGTIYRVLKGEEANRSTVQRLAKALNTTCEILTLPPQSREPDNADSFDTLLRDTLAYSYGISPEIVVSVGVHLFNSVAELAIQRRKRNLEEWAEKMQAALSEAPPLREDYMSISGHQFWDHYWAEHYDILENPLDAPPRAKSELDAELETDEEPETDTEKDYFFQMVDELGLDIYVDEGVSNLKSLDSGEGYLSGENVHSPLYRLLGDEDTSENYWPIYDTPLFEAAEDALHSGVSPIDIPIDLRGPDKSFERKLWIVSKYWGDLPEHVQHEDAVYRAQRVDLLQEMVSEKKKSLDQDVEGIWLSSYSIDFLRDKLSEAQSKLKPDDYNWLARKLEWERLNHQKLEAQSTLTPDDHTGKLNLAEDEGLDDQENANQGGASKNA